MEFNLAPYWVGREVARRGPGPGPAFEELESCSWFRREDVDIQYEGVKRSAARKWAGVSEGELAERLNILHVVVYEAWAAGMYEEAPEGFLAVVEKFRVSGHRSLLELVVIEGREGMPTAVPVRFRTAAKKWGACHADREKKEAAKEEDKRRARKPGEAREELAVRERMLRFGLASLPEVLVPPRATLNAYQAVVEANPELALPYVDVSRPPYTPRAPDWKVLREPAVAGSPGVPGGGGGHSGHVRRGYGGRVRRETSEAIRRGAEGRGRSGAAPGGREEAA
ncbi:hypothetical protein DIPPA_28346 [Diplonema papillatum]|nr:hypothetical protein DIPPA_28346 [Diplonema papillatum]